jgi:hypothetical protein
MKRHAIRLTGPRAKGARISALALRDLLDTLIASARHAVRLRVDGRGLAGQPPTWVERISDVEVLPLEAGSTQVVVEAPTLAEAAPERFSQADFLLDLDPESTCIDVMEESLADALAGNTASERFDAGLLKTFSGFARLWRYGIEAVELEGGLHSVRLDAGATNRLETFQRTIPADQHVVVVGKLDQLHHSRRMFTLRTDDGKDVRGLAGDDVRLEEFGPLFGQRASISGVARFRPSGETLLVEADVIEPAAAMPSIFSRAPKPLLPTGDSRALNRAQGPRSGVAAIFGRWPGEESDEEVIALLDEMS